MPVVQEPWQLDESEDSLRLTHYLFRYPAKFHPAVAQKLIDEFSEIGDTVLDPFCGSGTLIVEAIAKGRSAIGIDIDPVAAFVTSVKVHRFEPKSLRRSASVVNDHLVQLMRSDQEYKRRIFQDIGATQYDKTVADEDLDVPSIPNLFHWFRRYVIVDLARIKRTIQQAAIPQTHKNLLILCFAATIRNSSNADPVPVSGLEVTSHMKQLDALGRMINPFILFKRNVDRSLRATERYSSLVGPGQVARVINGDARRTARYFKQPVDTVITSPPYYAAVDYYRRHQLEMYWLDLTNSHEERLLLKPKYIGRPTVSRASLDGRGSLEMGPIATAWEMSMREASARQANSFRDYLLSLRSVFDQLAKVLSAQGRAVFVVGHSSWNSKKIPTSRLFEEAADELFELQAIHWYPIKNRYMSYSRKNGASIDKEYVLVFAK